MKEEKHYKNDIIDTAYIELTELVQAINTGVLGNSTSVEILKCRLNQIRILLKLGVSDEHII